MDHVRLRQPGESRVRQDAGSPFASAQAWRASLSHQPLKPPPTGADAAWDTVMSHILCRVPRRRRVLRRARQVVALEGEVAGYGSDRLVDEADRLRTVFRRRRETPEELTLAAAIIREAARRRLGMMPYPVQVAAGLAMIDGRLVEMATGEGKTLSAAIPAVVLGMRGRGCHIITANDYLAQRDAETMAPLYEAFGLSVAHVVGETPPDQRQAAYAADITYTTNKEVAADFLRDRVAMGYNPGVNASLLASLGGAHLRQGHTVMRGLECAIIDEADAILIDEAGTPLILSSQGENTDEKERYQHALQLADRLERGRDYRVDLKHREVDLTHAGRRRLTEITADMTGIWRGSRIREELVTQALTARLLFLCDQHYVIQEDKVVIVDESTGRLMPDRTWRHGLHQVIEVKEGLDPSPAQTTLASISFQKFFRLYRRLAGMTGTAWEARQEFQQTYRLSTVRVPTHRPCVRKHLAPVMCSGVDDKNARIIEDVKEYHALGRPVLLGTRNVDSSMALSRLLTEAGLAHEVLNAVHHEHEAKIIAGAGQRGAVTVATNMAGRGTDIKLGPGVAERGGLAVIAAEFNDDRRIDRQLFGRAGRQGDPGAARAYVCPYDDLLKRHGRALSVKLAARFFGPRAAVAIAQARARRLARHARKSVLRSDVWSEQFLGFVHPDH